MCYDLNYFLVFPLRTSGAVWNSVESTNFCLNLIEKEEATLRAVLEINTKLYSTSSYSCRFLCALPALVLVEEIIEMSVWKKNWIIFTILSLAHLRRFGNYSNICFGGGSSTVIARQHHAPLNLYQYKNRYLVEKNELCFWSELFSLEFAFNFPPTIRNCM